MADSQHLQGDDTRLKAAQTKSLTHYFRKFLFLALFLIAIPMFPAQAPEFVNQTILTKLWELLHLLFIGVAVSYGLFCRRNVDMDFEAQPTDDDSQSYVSRVFHVSSIFEDEYNNSYVYGEKNVGHAVYSGNYNDESVFKNSVNSEQNINGSLNHENLHAFSENNMTQAWNNQYFRGETMVFVDQPSYTVDEYGESRLRMTHRPLGLPVRSLRSRIGSQDSHEITNESESSSVLTDSSNSPSSLEHMNEQFGNMGPLNLENKFNETGGLSSPIRWHSRSGRREIRDGGIATHPLHLRPLSVDETQFESLKSQSFWSTESFSSQPSSMSDSPNRLSLSGNDSSELENWKSDETGKEKSFLRSTYPPASSPMNGKTSLNALRIRQYSSGSLFEKKSEKRSEADLRGRSGNKREYPLGGKESRSGSLKLNEKPANLVKAYSRGKSVRTIRPRGYAAEAMKVGEKSGDHNENEVAKAEKDDIEAVYKGKNQMKRDMKTEAVYKEKNEMKNGGFDTGGRKQNVDNHYPMPKPAFSEIQPKPIFSESQRRKNRERSEDFAVVFREESESEVENFQVKSDEEAVTNLANDAGRGFDPNEVDKKATEFIAKFREQIRLQKMQSIDKSKGLNSFR